MNTENTDFMNCEIQFWGGKENNQIRTSNLENKSTKVLPCKQFPNSIVERYRTAFVGYETERERKREKNVKQFV